MSEPFLRWLGGKRWLAPMLAPIIKGLLDGRRAFYREPFLGSGAMFLAIAPQNADLSDTNADLIRCFAHVSANADGLLKLLRQWPATKEFYDATRAAEGGTALEQAARFLYLNRCSYGGLHRTNKQGQFNAAFGGGSRTHAPLWEDGLLASAALTMRRCRLDLNVQDFETSLARARRGDVVYCDPPYADGQGEAFDRYGARIFSPADQERLAAAAHAAFSRGATVLVSHAASPRIAALYEDAVVLEFWKNKRVGNRALNAATHCEKVFVLDPKGRALLWRSAARGTGEAYGPRPALIAS